MISNWGFAEAASKQADELLTASQSCRIPASCIFVRIFTFQNVLIWHNHLRVLSQPQIFYHNGTPPTFIPSHNFFSVLSEFSCHNHICHARSGPPAYLSGFSDLSVFLKGASPTWRFQICLNFQIFLEDFLLWRQRSKKSYLLLISIYSFLIFHKGLFSVWIIFHSLGLCLVAASSVCVCLFSTGLW